MGRPQLYAALFLLAFFGQCFWVQHTQKFSVDEENTLYAGHELWRGEQITQQISRVAALAASSVVVLRYPNPYPPISDDPVAEFHWASWNARFPFIACGILFGFSLWHVARRLYGNTGGYIALALYSFSPLMIVASATVGHDTIAAWGLFGAVFTAIALSHTLLAPPADRVRRTILLGVALGMGVGADYSVAMALPVVLALMLYLAPDRRSVAIAWLAAAGVVAKLILWAVFFFDTGALLTALRQARFFALRPTEVAGGIPYDALVTWLVATLPGLVLFALALMGFARSRRSRYFGNTLPLAVGGALFVMSLATPYYLSVKYLIWALPFLYLFGAGVFADLLEEQSSRLWARRVVLGVLVANAVGCVTFLAKVV